MYKQAPRPIDLRATVSAHESGTILTTVGDSQLCFTPGMARSLAYRLLEAVDSIEHAQPGHEFVPTVIDETTSKHRPALLRLPK